ncbi:NADH-quinone oxidoreductase subunit J [Aquipuribacter nitratireducens]|uniref:NADH-quinone oxidoreductase subunit J n=1 Tax=Aquipuribacter nitratireducens TaxID=650104 RepID=A0ABW0GM89_9MICO
MSAHVALAVAETGAEVGSSAGDAALFWTLGPLMVLASLGLIFARKAVHAALSMAVVMVSLGGVYVGLQAPFLGMVQVFVYTGAVMMLFLFVLMLVGVDSSDSLVETIRGQRLAALLAGGGFTIFVLVALGRTAWPEPVGLQAVNEAGNITGIAERIFSRYVWSFELTAALLVVAAIGAMVLAHRERTGERPTQRSISEARLRRGQRMTPLPPPGTFARHNAVDTPALLPDGSPSELSVSRVLQARGQTLSTTTLVDDVPEIVADVDPDGRGSRTRGSAVGGHPIDRDHPRHGDGPLGEDTATGDASDGTSDSASTRKA